MNSAVVVSTRLNGFAEFVFDDMKRSRLRPAVL
ncbi:MAG: hypothetical protein JWR26_2674 [Pedosphaera sp.]|nr:hypothetical protein [Pedosphaera sp.]